MVDRVAASRYAEALLEVSEREGVSEGISKELGELPKVIGKGAPLRTLLEAPNVSVDAKINFLENVFKDRISIYLFNFLMLLVLRRRINLFEEILGHFEDFYKERIGILPAEVTSAVAVDVEEFQHLKEKLSIITGKKIEMHVAVNPELLGGVIVQMRDKIIDGSVRSMLKELRERLLEIPIH